jgi:hypothetical protein
VTAWVVVHTLVSNDVIGINAFCRPHGDALAFLSPSPLSGWQRDCHPPNAGTCPAHIMYYPQSGEFDEAPQIGANNAEKGLKALQNPLLPLAEAQEALLALSSLQGPARPGYVSGALGRMQVVVHCEYVASRYPRHAGTAEPLRVSPLEAVAYLGELHRAIQSV